MKKQVTKPAKKAKAKPKVKPIPKKTDKWMKGKRTMHRTIEDPVLILKTPKSNESAIRIDKNQRWPNKPSEHLDQRKKIFKSYLQNQLDYVHKDITILLKLWDYYFNADNIMGYTHLPTDKLYQGIINDNVHLMYRAPKIAVEH
jgi:hypothetical protein